ncbi:MAG: hypothetical protein EXR70_15075 [Deltaproteobacteria bacterium]|nr:hypothetical protein [Deltaproteobacteria bacterium]
MVGQLSLVCPQCQTGNAFDAQFCDECGAPFDAHCTRCGESNRDSAKFCKKYGNRFNLTERIGENANLSGAIPFSDKAGPMLAPPHHLAGERKRVTVLFADIRDSTSFIEKLDPEQVRKHFDPVLRIMMDAVRRYGGIVNQVLGDGIMALFGAPLAHEDHAVRACYAALAMQEEMRRGADMFGTLPVGALRIGVGLNSGEVVVSSILNDLNIDYSALGHTTHLAARMQELAAPGAILLTAASAREVEDFVQLKNLGARQVKGVTQPIEVFELLGVTGARTRLQAAARRGCCSKVIMSGLSSFHPDIITLPLTPDIITLLQHCA